MDRQVVTMQLGIPHRAANDPVMRLLMDTNNQAEAHDLICPMTSLMLIGMIFTAVWIGGAVQWNRATTAKQLLQAKVAVGIGVGFSMVITSLSLAVFGPTMAHWFQRAGFRIG